MRKLYKTFEIKIFEEQNSGINLTENSNLYPKIYFDENYDKNRFIRANKYAITISESGLEISSAIIGKTNSATGIYENSFIIEDDTIWVSISNTIYCLSIPALNLIWQKEFDIAVNFGIYKLANDFLIHGELLIFRITKEGEILWEFGGRDIWVNLKNKKEFTLEKDRIRLFDFESNEYVLDFNGNLIEDNPRSIL